MVKSGVVIAVIMTALIEMRQPSCQRRRRLSIGFYLPQRNADARTAVTVARDRRWRFPSRALSLAWRLKRE